MRSKGSSRQLTLIIVLMVILIVLLGALVAITFMKADETAAPVESVPAPEEVKPEIIVEPSESVPPVEESKEESSLPEEKPEPSKPAPESKPAPSKPVAYEISHKVFDKEGASYEAREFIKNGYIDNGNIAVRNRTFNENLYITANAEDDPIVLQNIIVKGKIVINGSDNVTMHDVKAPLVEINTNNRENNLIISGVSTIDRVALKSSCTIDEENLAKGFPGVKEIVIEDNPNYLWLDVDLCDTDVDLVYVGSLANVNVDRESTVKTMTAASMLHIGGYGEVEKLNVYSDGVTYNTRPVEINVNGKCDYPEYSKEKIDGKIKK